MNALTSKWRFSAALKLTTGPAYQQRIGSKHKNNSD